MPNRILGSRRDEADEHPRRSGQVRRVLVGVPRSVPAPSTTGV